MTPDEKVFLRRVYETDVAQMLAVAMSHSHDLIGATWEELRAIKREARRIVQQENPELWDIGVKRSPEPAA